VTVIVSGATGFLGSAFLRQLQEPVVAVLRGSDFEARARTLARRTGLDVRGLHGDVTVDRWGLSDELAPLAGEVRAVVNVAGDVAWSDPWSALSAVNVAGARHAVEVAAAVGAPLLHVSSLYAAYDYGDEVPEALVPEQAHLSKYERSKVRGEHAVAERARELGVPARIVRVGALSGDLAPQPGSRDGSSRVPFARLIAGGSWPIFPYATEARLDICPRDLVARRMAAYLDAGPPEDGVAVHNVGQGAAAPLIGAVAHEAAAASRGTLGRMPRPVPVPRRWLLRVSAMADRASRGVTGSAAIGLRYFASPTVFVTEGLGAEVSLRSLVRTIGLPHQRPAEELDRYYDGWSA
jgi:nucleoside-diphosphate-sugar epimerase